MNDLTEQWKKGELPEGFYYIKVKEVIANYPLLADCVEGLSYTYFLDYEDYVTEVLAPVPSYEECQKLLSDQLAKIEGEEIVAELEADNKRLKHDVGNLGYKIKNQRHEIERQIAQNAQLKELLESALSWLPDSSKFRAGRYAQLQSLERKIKEVLK